MSEQLETIKCVDWTVDFLAAGGGGSRCGPSASAEIFHLLCAPAEFRAPRTFIRGG